VKTFSFQRSKMTEIRKLKQRKSRVAARYILTVALVIVKK